MTDREKVKAFLLHLSLNAYEYRQSDDTVCGYDYLDVERISDDALSLLKEQEERWIPVTERLPRGMANKVLVYVQHEDYVGYIGYGHYEKYKGQEMWFDLEHDEEFSKRGYHVTHWMETPMPPIEGR